MFGRFGEVVACVQNQNLYSSGRLERAERPGIRGSYHQGNSNPRMILNGVMALARCG